MTLGSIVSNHTTWYIYLVTFLVLENCFLHIWLNLQLGLLAANLSFADNQLQPDLLISSTWCQKTKFQYKMESPRHQQSNSCGRQLFYS